MSTEAIERTLRRPCPLCGAQDGELCRWGKGGKTRTRMHLHRRDEPDRPAFPDDFEVYSEDPERYAAVNPDWNAPDGVLPA